MIITGGNFDESDWTERGGHSRHGGSEILLKTLRSGRHG
jgi:hypothetical protein